MARRRFQPFLTDVPAPTSELIRALFPVYGASLSIGSRVPVVEPLLQSSSVNTKSL